MIEITVFSVQNGVSFTGASSISLLSTDSIFVVAKYARAHAISFARNTMLESICVKYFQWVYFILFWCLPEFKVIYKTGYKVVYGIVSGGLAQIVYYTASN